MRSEIRTVVSVAVACAPLLGLTAALAQPSETLGSLHAPGAPNGALIANSAIPETTTAIVPLSRIELFNGQDLNGWKVVTRSNAPAENTWTVSNAVLHCSGGPIGYLRTAKGYRDYRLTVEWRFVKLTPKTDNTGILVHIQPPDEVWPRCIQCQGRHDKVGDLFLMAGAESKEHQGKDANTPLPKQGPSYEKPVGEWNSCELVCEGTRVKALVNGKLMNETTECTISSGFIGIQCEGAEIEIRKMALEPLK